MTVVIKRSLDKKSIDKLIDKLKSAKRFDAYKYLGKIHLPLSPLEIQKQLRGEWK